MQDSAVGRKTGRQRGKEGLAGVGGRRRARLKDIQTNAQSRRSMLSGLKRSHTPQQCAIAAVAPPLRPRPACSRPPCFAPISRTQCQGSVSRPVSRYLKRRSAGLGAGAQNNLQMMAGGYLTLSHGYAESSKILTLHQYAAHTRRRRRRHRAQRTGARANARPDTAAHRDICAGSRAPRNHPASTRSRPSQTGRANMRHTLHLLSCARLHRCH